MYQHPLETRMPSRFISVLVCSVFFLALSACGGGSILNDQSTFTTASQSATLEQVKRTIITAAAIKGWRPKLGSPGHIFAYRRQAGKTAKVDISYTSSSFNIKYVDSDNMQYTGSSISSTYTEWVDELRDEIKARLSRL